MKDILEKEREESKADVVKIKSQARKIRDLEMRDKHQQKEVWSAIIKHNLISYTSLNIYILNVTPAHFISLQ